MMKRLPLVADNELPDGKAWEDKGCSYYPSCLTCPFEHCRYDVHQNISHSYGTAQKIIELHSQNYTVDGIMNVMGVSRARVVRALRS